MNVHDANAGNMPPRVDPSITAAEANAGQSEACADCEAAGFDHDALVKAEIAAAPPAPAAPPPEVIEGPGWENGRIANLRGLNDAGRRLRKTLEAVREAEQMAQEEEAPLLAEIEAISARLAKTLAPLKERAQRLEGHIRGFCAFEENRAEILKGLPAKAKSKTLPSGLKLAWRHDPGGYRWDDSMKPSEREAELMGWAVGEEARSGETLTRAVWYADLENIKKHLAGLDAGGARDEGEPRAPPGLKYVEPADVLSITTDKDGGEP